MDGLSPSQLAQHLGGMERELSFPMRDIPLNRQTPLLSNFGSRESFNLPDTLLDTEIDLVRLCRSLQHWTYPVCVDRLLIDEGGHTVSRLDLGLDLSCSKAEQKQEMGRVRISEKNSTRSKIEFVPELWLDLSQGLTGCSSVDFDPAAYKALTEHRLAKGDVKSLRMRVGDIVPVTESIKFSEAFSQSDARQGGGRTVDMVKDGNAFTATRRVPLGWVYKATLAFGPPREGATIFKSSKDWTELDLVLKLRPVSRVSPSKYGDLLRQTRRGLRSLIENI